MDSAIMLGVIGKLTELVEALTEQQSRVVAALLQRQAIIPPESVVRSAPIYVPEITPEMQQVMGTPPPSDPEDPANTWTDVGP